MTVASAAPRTPISNAKINMGSSMMFATAPVIIVIIAAFAMPTERRRLFPVIATTNNGEARIMML